MNLGYEILFNFDISFYDFLIFTHPEQVPVRFRWPCPYIRCQFLPAAAAGAWTTGCKASSGPRARTPASTTSWRRRNPRRLDRQPEQIDGNNSVFFYGPFVEEIIIIIVNISCLVKIWKANINQRWLKMVIVTFNYLFFWETYFNSANETFIFKDYGVSFC